MADNPSAAQVRALLRESGYDVPARGGVSAEHRAIYDELTGNGSGPASPPGEDADVTDAGLPPAPDPAEDADAPPASVSPGRGEARPRRVRVSTRRGRPSLRDKLTGSSGRAKPKRKHPRVPTDRLIERGWEMLSRLAMPISPPVANCLALQSPVAGLILEDVVRDTVVDRALQPIARAEARAEKVAALVGPPVIVGALAAAEGLPPEQRAMRQAILVPLLRESMVLWVQVAGDKVEAKAARDAESGPVMEQVDALLAQIFPMPAPAPGQGVPV